MINTYYSTPLSLEMEAVIARTRARLHTTLLDAEDQMK